MNVSSRFFFHPHGTLLLLITLLVSIRVGLLGFLLDQAVTCAGCFITPILQGEAQFYGYLGVVYLLSLVIPSVIAGVTARLLIISALLLSIADLIVIYSFHLRLTFDDVLKFSKHLNASSTVVAQAVDSPLVLAASLLGVVVVFTLFYRFIRTGIKLSSVMIGVVLLVTTSLLSYGHYRSGQKYVHSWAYKNLFEINLNTGHRTPYSQGFSQSLRQRYPSGNVPTHCSSTTPSASNVIVVLFESLSMYHSRLFSGLYDMVPLIDKMAQQGTRYENFYANGFTTEAGLIALLTSESPLPTPKTSGDNISFSDYSNTADSLPRLFDRHGYSTHFLTTGDLSFLEKGAWLRQIGFGTVEGSEASFYQDWPRFHFNAAPDQALYRRALQLIDQQQDNYFLTLENVTTHHPYIDPDSGEHSEAKTFAYADQALWGFYQGLVERNFFEQGVLLVMSDHRSMTPLRRGEIQQYGDDALARVPFYVLGKGFSNQTVAAAYQQADALNSLKYYLGEKSCATPTKGNFFVAQQAPACILHSGGHDRSLVSVFCDGYTGAIALDGDKSGFVDGVGPGRHAQLLLDQVNYTRIVSDKAAQ